MRSEFVAALQILNKYLQIVNPKEVDVLILKGNILDASGDFETAKRVYKQVLRLAPRNPVPLIDLAGYYLLGEPSRARTALRYYNKALKLLWSGRFYADIEDEITEVCLGKSDALIKLGRPSDAIRCLLKGLEKYPFASRLTEAIKRVQRVSVRNKKPRPSISVPSKHL